jgi:putative MFS transporter
MPEKRGWSAALFWFGVLAVISGVAIHIPMFIESQAMSHSMAGMAGMAGMADMAGTPVYRSMAVGMSLIVIGTVAAGFALASGMRLDRSKAAANPVSVSIQWGSDSRLGGPHCVLLLVLSIALIIDTMKPATLGFVLPGVAHEYGLPRSTAALLPLFALTGTALGSFIWGWWADALGRRSAILLASIVFIGTSICGTMPTFEWNLAMCFLMGMSAGGMLPIVFALLAETIPPRYRGVVLVLLGGVGVVGGFVAASGAAALLEPIFGWRILWLLGLPTGMVLVALNRFIPESPNFLLLRGRADEAISLIARYGAIATVRSAPVQALPSTPGAGSAFLGNGLAGPTLALNLSSLCWGLVNFGILLWLPMELRAKGSSVSSSDFLLAQSALVALPTVGLTAWMYGKWSTMRTFLLVSILTTGGLIGVAMLGAGLAWIQEYRLAVMALLICGSAGLAAVLLPYSAEIYPTLVRGTGTGLVAGSGKLGGVFAQCLTLTPFVPTLAVASISLAAAVVVSALLVVRYGIETRGRELV